MLYLLDRFRLGMLSRVRLVQPEKTPDFCILVTLLAENCTPDSAVQSRKQDCPMVLTLLSVMSIEVSTVLPLKALASNSVTSYLPPAYSMPSVSTSAPL